MPARSGMALENQDRRLGFTFAADTLANISLACIAGFSPAWSEKSRKAWSRKTTRRSGQVRPAHDRPRPETAGRVHRPSQRNAVRPQALVGRARLAGLPTEQAGSLARIAGAPRDRDRRCS